MASSCGGQQHSHFKAFFLKELRPILELDYPMRVERVSRFHARHLEDEKRGRRVAWGHRVCRNPFINKDLTSPFAMEDNTQFGERRRSYLTEGRTCRKTP